MQESEKKEILNSAISYLNGFIGNNNEAGDDEASENKKCEFIDGIDINKLQIDRMNMELERIPVKKGKRDLYKELFEDLQNRLGSIRDTRKLGKKMGSSENLLKSWKGVQDFLLNQDNTD